MQCNMGKDVESIMKKENIEVGDIVHIKAASGHHEGKFMGKSSHDSKCIVLKLQNGYNIGIDINNIQQIKLVSERTEHLNNKSKEGSTANNNLPRITLIATGGTIGSKIDYERGGVSAKLAPHDLVELVPELAKVVRITEVYSPFTKLSEDMEIEDWVKIAEVCYAELLKSNVDGVILTHGTDTLAYTAAALSFLIKDVNKPLVLVGAQRSSDRGSSDTFMNLLCAAHVAASDIAEIGICMHGTTNDDYSIFIRGTKVRKMHTSRRDAFRPINDLPLAKVYPNGTIEELQVCKKKNKSTKPELNIKTSSKVAILKFHPGANPETIENYQKQGIKGIIIEGTGLGHVNRKWIPYIQKAVRKGMLIFFTAQTIYGKLNLNVYSTGRELLEAGVVPLADMTTEVAFVKLCVLLGNHPNDPQLVKSKMQENLAGEFNERLSMNCFLN